MIGSDVIRGYIDIMILYILLEEDSYGYEISKKIIKLTDAKYTIKETTLYSAFTRLERNQYIDSYSNDSLNNRRTYYKITEVGKEYYQEKCVEWLLTKEVVDRFIKEDKNGYY